jgi:hypothetical protein
MSATIDEPLAFGVREERALGPLRAALATAIRRNRPVLSDVQLPQPELVKLAVRLCRHDDANVAVIPGPHGGVIFVPV